MTLLKQINSEVVAAAGAFATTWCVYSVREAPLPGDPIETLFIGSARLIELYAFPDAQRNTEWLRRVTPDTQLIVTVLYLGDKVECWNEASRLSLTEPRPICNRLGLNMHGSSRPILCSNGQRYETQTEAAQALGINQAQLSQHLQRKPGFKSVKGLTFGYADV